MLFHLMYHLIVFKSDKHPKNCGGNPCFNFDLQFSYPHPWLMQEIQINNRPKLLTWFLGELPLRGSSAANMALEMRMQISTTLPKYE
jgi:hypothetical protein